MGTVEGMVLDQAVKCWVLAGTAEYMVSIRTVGCLFLAKDFGMSGHRSWESLLPARNQACLI